MIFPNIFCETKYFLWTKKTATFKVVIRQRNLRKTVNIRRFGLVGIAMKIEGIRTCDLRVMFWKTPTFKVVIRPRNLRKTIKIRRFGLVGGFWSVFRKFLRPIAILSAGVFFVHFVCSVRSFWIQWTHIFCRHIHIYFIHNLGKT